jgi:hypothetical protein
MLKNTFLHLHGVGEIGEKQLWEKGFTSWDKILKRGNGLGESRYRRLKAGVLESIARLDELDHGYFKKGLQNRHIWRAYPEFRENACFLDIETTGLSPEYDDVTTVCVHSGGDTKSYIFGENLDDLGDDLEDFGYIVTFNGARFDLPFLSKRLGLRFYQMHLDLYYPLASLGFRGGLKSIEKQLKLSRKSDGVTGYDAVRLWRSYKSGRTIEVAKKKVAGDDALKMLLDYNREDTVNLEKLADKAFKMLRKRTFTVKS